MLLGEADTHPDGAVSLREWVWSWVYSKPASVCQSDLFHLSVGCEWLYTPGWAFQDQYKKRLFFLKHTKFSLQIAVCGLLVNIPLDQLPPSSGHLDFALLTSVLLSVGLLSYGAPP